MLATTVATFEEVSTVPVTTCPACATDVLSAIERICGAAFGEAGTRRGAGVPPAGSRTTGSTADVGAGSGVAASGAGAAGLAEAAGASFTALDGVAVAPGEGVALGEGCVGT